jgi:hypothetical protein
MREFSMSDAAVRPSIPDSADSSVVAILRALSDILIAAALDGSTSDRAFKDYSFDPEEGSANVSPLGSSQRESTHLHDEKGPGLFVHRVEEDSGQSVREQSSERRPHRP